jgi:hypothetical protein
MTNDTGPRLLYGTNLVLPPGARDVTLSGGTIFGIVGAEAFRPRPARKPGEAAFAKMAATDSSWDDRC